MLHGHCRCTLRTHEENRWCWLISVLLISSVTSSLLPATYIHTTLCWGLPLEDITFVWLKWFSLCLFKPLYREGTELLSCRLWSRLGLCLVTSVLLSRPHTRWSLTLFYLTSPQCWPKGCVVATLEITMVRFNRRLYHCYVFGESIVDVCYTFVVIVCTVFLGCPDWLPCIRLRTR